MQPRFKLRIRLLLLLWGIFFLVLFLPSAYYNRYLRDEILQENQERASKELALIERLMSGQKFAGPEQMHEWLTQIAEPLKLRITYVAESGQVIADTDIPYAKLPTMDNHSGRPEIEEAYRHSQGTSVRHSRTLNADLLYVARELGPNGQIPGGVLRVSVQLSGIFHVMGNVEKIQYLVILIGLISFMIISLGLIASTNWSIRLLSDAAGSIGEGIPKFPAQFNSGHDFYPLAKSIHETAKRMASYIDTITSQKKQMESILEGVEEGILLLNASGKIESANRAAAMMFSSTPRLIGRVPLEVIRNSEIQNACTKILVEEIHSFHGEVSIGHDKFYHVNIVRPASPTRQFGAIVVLHDISGLKHLERIRRDFVANASHELRTPLTSIKGYTELLMGDEGDPEIRGSCLDTILKNTDHIIKLVDDLLLLAKAEDFRSVLDVRPVDPGEALLEAWRACARIAEENNVTLRNNIPDPCPPVLADPEQLVQVFRNLLENAVRYSPSGEFIEVGAKLDGDYLMFMVSDNGPGIPLHDQQKIFERFFRVQRHHGKTTGSTGLGLAICRNILSKHGGTIWVESPREGHRSGSAFHFSLPVQPVSETVI